MKFGIYAHTHAGLADVAGLAELASEASASGWDGFFIWDQLFQEGIPVVDTQTALGAIALATRGTDLGIGPLVIPLARRRPWKVARELATLDGMAPGRVVCGAGIGDGSDFEVASSEPLDLKARAATFEDSLEIVKTLLHGDGQWEQSADHAERTGIGPGAEPLRVEMREAFLPAPRPIPVWGSAVVVRPGGKGQKKRPFRRAAEMMEGLFPIVTVDGEFSVDNCLTPGEVRRSIEWAEAGRSDDSLPPEFDVVASGRATTPNSPADLEGLREAGLTWWLEALPMEATLESTRELIKKGPPTPS